MFFHDIDSWTKKKLLALTICWGFFYVVFATILPIIFVCTKYEIFSHSVKLTLAGLIVAIFVLSFGTKFIHWVVGVLPQEKKGQQIVRYSLECIFALVIPLVIIWITHLIKVDLDKALDTIKLCCFSYMGAILVENFGLKSLMYQWKCNADVDHLEKLDNIKAARRRNR